MGATHRGRSAGSAPKKPAHLAEGLETEQHCDCSGCSGEPVDLQELIEDLRSVATELDDSADPLDAEVAATALLALGADDPDAFAAELVEGIVPQVGAWGDRAALVLLRALATVADGRVGAAAGAAAGALAAAGIQSKVAAGLGEPVTVTDCWRLDDSDGEIALICAAFQRAGHQHAIVVGVDPDDCDAAAEVFVVPPDGMAEAFEMAKGGVTPDGLELTGTVLRPEAYLRQVTDALDVRAAHDEADAALGLIVESDPDGQDPLAYAAAVLLLRARLRDLPGSQRPAVPHDCRREPVSDPAALQALVKIAQNSVAGGARPGVGS